MVVFIKTTRLRNGNIHRPHKILVCQTDMLFFIRQRVVLETQIAFRPNCPFPSKETVYFSTN